MSKCVYESIINIVNSISNKSDSESSSDYENIFGFVNNIIEIMKNIFQKTKKLILFLTCIFLMWLFFYSNQNLKYTDILPKISITLKNPKYLNELFKSRELFIKGDKITNEYIKYIKPIKKTNYNSLKNLGIKIEENYFKKREDQLNFVEFGKLCVREELLSQRKITLSGQPLISIIVPSYNKEINIIKSIRSIQNQSLKNIEIIIVDDCSSHKSRSIFKNLLKSDPRIRLFVHLENMGVWRSRVDGFLYSRGKYIMTLDPDDLYEDNYVLEDLYNLMEKYELDSAKMLFRLIYDHKNLKDNKLPFDIEFNSSEIIGRKRIEKYNSDKLDWGFGVIWNRITRSDVYAKGLSLLSDDVLNIYKNFCDDQWWNKIGDAASYTFVIVKRFGYLYYHDPNGPSRMIMRTDEQKDKFIQEYIGFLYFDYDFLPKYNDKKDIIKRLRSYNRKKKRVKLHNLKSKFYMLNNILNKLADDPYVSTEDKIFVYKLLLDSIERQNDIKK